MNDDNLETITVNGVKYVKAYETNKKFGLGVVVRNSMSGLASHESEIRKLTDALRQFISSYPEPGGFDITLKARPLRIEEVDARLSQAEAANGNPIR